jgi:hypothetical protein
MKSKKKKLDIDDILRYDSCILRHSGNRGAADDKSIFFAMLLPFKQYCGSMTILGWIRICGSMPLTNVSGFNTILSAYFFLKLHLHYFSKIKSQKESHRGTRGAEYVAVFNKVLKFAMYISPLHLNLYIALHLQGDSKYVHVQ